MPCAACAKTRAALAEAARATVSGNLPSAKAAVSEAAAALREKAEALRVRVRLGIR